MSDQQTGLHDYSIRACFNETILQQSRNQTKTATYTLALKCTADQFADCVNKTILNYKSAAFETDAFYIACQDLKDLARAAAETNNGEKLAKIRAVLSHTVEPDEDKKDTLTGILHDLAKFEKVQDKPLVKKR